MKQHLHKKTLPLIAFLFLALLVNDRLLANPPTPTCPIVTERFQGLGDGATVNNSATGWFLNSSQVSGSGYFAVKSNRFHAQELGGEGIWYSKVFSVSGYSDFQVAVKVSSEGDMNSSEYVRIYYKVNGGSETLLESRTGNFGTIDFISPTLNGNNVQLVVKLYNYNNGGSQTSKYYIEEYRVFKEHGPCANSIPVSITASGSGVLTCANSSLTLSAGTSASGTTTWSWTGPGGFTSTAQNPTVTVAGTYTAVGTNAAGSGSSTFTVTENKVAPVVTATGGALACGSSVVLGATSSVTSTYSWSGPGGFTSTLQNPTVSVAGNYIVTVTNSSNGCTASQTATVTAGSVTASTIWLQEFTRPNGSTSGNAPNAWTSSVPLGNFSVQNNVFYVNSNGNGSSEGVWTSESFSITGKTNVSISVSVRSGVSSGGALESSGSSLDYMRMYYRLNGGAEVLFREYLGTINSNSATFSIASIGSLTGSTLQIIIRGRTTTSDEHYYFDNVTVTGITGGPVLTPSVTGNVTCTSTAQLSATVTDGVASSYAWTGPNGFTSAIQNPVVSAGGQYTVTATLSGGCTVSAPITITENKTLPDISASGGALACNTSITLNANSAVSGATYSWTGPNSYSSNSKNPVVTAPGSYTVTVTNPANGCTASQTVSVTPGQTVSTSFWQEDFTFPDGTTVDNATATTWSTSTSGSGTYSVVANEFKTSFNSDAEGVWTSQSINISGKTGINLSIFLKSEVAASNVWETSDYIRICYRLNGGSQILLYEELAGIGSNTTGTASATVNLSLPVGNTIQLIIKTRNTGTTEKYYFDNINITASSPLVENVTASSTGVLSCSVTSVNLSGTSTTSGLSYAWTGPNGFTSSLQNPSVTAAGIYTLTVTNPATGCTGTDTALVIANGTQPSVSASVSGSLSCTTSSVTISAASATQGLSYSWTGPNGFTSTAQNPSVTAGGDYIVTVTSGGCIAKDTVTVSQNTAVPANLNITSSTGSNEFNCYVGGFTMTASSSTAGTTYNWLMPNGVSFDGSSSGTIGPGDYIVTATHPVTGCTLKDTFTAVNNYAMASDGLITLSPAALTCTNSSVTLTGSNSLAGVTYTWVTGTGEFLGSGPTLTVTEPGFFNLVMKHPVSGCNHTIARAVTVVSDPPLNVTISTLSANTQINCISGSVTLRGNSTSTATYAWTGPNGYTSSGSDAVITAPGVYTMTVTNTASGCSTSMNTTVISNTIKPTDVLATAITNGGQLTCTHTSINLSGSSSTTGGNYSWTGPSGFTGSGSSIAVMDSGRYTLTVMDPANGCAESSGVTITANKTQPAGVSATHADILTCLTTSTDLSGNSSTPGASYLWTGPGGFSAITRNTVASAPGTYFLKVTNPANGCSRTVSTIVEQDITPPADVTASNNGPLTCQVVEVTLTGGTSAMDVDYAWKDPDGNFISFAPTVVVSNSGTYTFIVTDLASNGCADTATTTVQFNQVGCSDKMATPPVKQPVALADSEQPAREFTHKVYPNPTTDHAFIEFRSPGNDHVTVKIVNSNASGEKMIFNNRVIAGHTYKLVWNAGDLPAGMYYSIITVNGKAYSNKLILIR